MITRKQYMNKECTHHEYNSQFVTEATKRFVLSELKVEDIKHALENGDEHLNKIKIPFNNMGSYGGWWWDNAPINTGLVRECGDNLSPSTYTCVAKAAARILINEAL
tara:strand:- start:31 stop:351 length:321 start_codon:yes stop_codon:yes gene_type:complete